jgi:hypothetical protein
LIIVNLFDVFVVLFNNNNKERMILLKEQLSTARISKLYCDEQQYQSYCYMLNIILINVLIWSGSQTNQHATCADIYINDSADCRIYIIIIHTLFEWLIPKTHRNHINQYAIPIFRTFLVYALLKLYFPKPRYFNYHLILTLILGRQGRKIRERKL